MNPMNPLPIECIGVIGLGYVGLSLATAFGRVLPTVGFDIDPDRIRELQAGHDRTGEMRPESLKVPQLVLTHDPDRLRRADFLIVTVPTPVDRAKRPDLSHLVDASRLIGHVLKTSRPMTDDRLQAAGRQSNKPKRPNQPNKPIIVYESTVYPGCIEEVCIPVVEQESGRKAGKDFMVGYSPERINPGDPEHTLETIVKVVAAQDGETAETMTAVYGLVVKAGVYRAPDIKTAEAAKVIENIQRDLNIALMNELAMVFHRLGIDTQEVLKAAQTKWNFFAIRARPGGRALHSGGPILFDAQGPGSGLSPGSHPGGTTDQRFNGSVRGTGNNQVAHRGRKECARCFRPRVGCHL
jgi:UDP-N-acetyl-D-galactosamine dehydrogenase